MRQRKDWRTRLALWLLGPTDLFEREADFHVPSVEAPFALPPRTSLGCIDCGGAGFDTGIARGGVYMKCGTCERAGK